MIRANLSHFLELGSALEKFRKFKSSIVGFEADGIDTYLALHSLWICLHRLNDNSEFLRVTKHPLQSLVEAVDSAMEECHEAGKDGSPRRLKNKVRTYNISTISTHIDTFEHVFAAECLDTPSYVVEKVGIFNTKDLVENTLQQIPEHLLALMDQSAKDDFESAGRCLAFKLNNASAFHSLRSVESILHGYVAYFTDEATADECKSWANFVSKLNEVAKQKNRSVGPSRKVIRNIDQMRDLDRNPIMHPRDNLNASDAFILFQNATTALISMLTELSELPEAQPDLLEKVPD